jgi:hypothetical protein
MCYYQISTYTRRERKKDGQREKKTTHRHSNFVFDISSIGSGAPGNIFFLYFYYFIQKSLIIKNEQEMRAECVFITECLFVLEEHC